MNANSVDLANGLQAELMMCEQLAATLLAKLKCSPAVHGITYQPKIELDFIAKDRSDKRRIGIRAVANPVGLSTEIIRNFLLLDEKVDSLILFVPENAPFDAALLQSPCSPKVLVCTSAEIVVNELKKELATGMKIRAPIRFESFQSKPPLEAL